MPRETMTNCPLCGQRFSNDGWRWLCESCFGGMLWDGSDEQKALLRALHILANPPGGVWNDADLQLVADSAAFCKIAEDVLPKLEARSLQNLLKRILKHVESPTD